MGAHRLQRPFMIYYCIFWNFYNLYMVWINEHCLSVSWAVLSVCLGVTRTCYYHNAACSLTTNYCWKVRNRMNLEFFIPMYFNVLFCFFFFQSSSSLDDDGFNSANAPSELSIMNARSKMRNQIWFVGKMNRVEAERRLMQGKHQDFLIRESTNRVSMDFYETLPTFIKRYMYEVLLI